MRLAKCIIKVAETTTITDDATVKLREYRKTTSPPRNSINATERSSGSDAIRPGMRHAIRVANRRWRKRAWVWGTSPTISDWYARSHCLINMATELTPRLPVSEVNHRPFTQSAMLEGENGGCSAVDMEAFIMAGVSSAMDFRVSDISCRTDRVKLSVSGLSNL